MFWSGSAGAIYPIIRRLQKRCLIEQVGEPINNRRGKLFAVTDPGVETLNSWIFRPLDPLVTGTPPDSLRNRVELLAILPMATQKEFLLGVIGSLEKQLEICDEDLRGIKGGDLYEYASCRGSVLHAQTRLRWIKELSATLNAVS